MIVSIQHNKMLTKHMNNNNMEMGKGDVVKVLCCTIHHYKYTRKKYLNMERVQRLKNSVVLRRETNKISNDESLCIIIFTHQELPNGNDLIDLYPLDQWC